MQLDGLAKKLEAERAATLVNSGIDKAPEAYSNAETDMRHEIEALCVITVRAPAGITLKVKATAAAISRSRRLSHVGRSRRGASSFVKDVNIALFQSSDKRLSRFLSVYLFFVGV
ncbi:hypothetical protein HGP16_31875 [Rhizobium sp. P40RR-XXII]|uniref:hypothetical protein n=1 Tax=Rhizobium sp. P40RR-XXII TaxID=2726739 RepID=UPI0014569528|nr:hypothetical protein [Rhizobium sp. P40RR-XXII]NLS21100.1 hypothetical protein [Rhizobium sp. P40RR-XXII]